MAAVGLGQVTQAKWQAVSDLMVALGPILLTYPLTAGNIVVVASS